MELLLLGSRRWKAKARVTLRVKQKQSPSIKRLRDHQDEWASSETRRSSLDPRDKEQRGKLIDQLLLLLPLFARKQPLIRLFAQLLSL